MIEREKGARLSPEIYVYATNKNFLNVYDALRIDKVKIEVAGYDPNTKRQTGHASAWLDRAEARLLTHLISFRLFAAVTKGKWEKFGGSQREDGSVESRTLVVEWDEGEGGRYAKYPYRLTIANGPGKKTALGAVAPAGEPTERLSMRLPEADMIKIMLAVSAYISAYETAHHHRLVAETMRELDAKFAERSAQPSRNPVEIAPAERPRVVPQPLPQPQREPRRETAARTGATFERNTTYNASAQGGESARPSLRSIPGGNAADRDLRASRLG